MNHALLMNDLNMEHKVVVVFHVHNHQKNQNQNQNQNQSHVLDQATDDEEGAQNQNQNQNPYQSPSRGKEKEKIGTKTDEVEGTELDEMNDVFNGKRLDRVVSEINANSPTMRVKARE